MASSLMKLERLSEQLKSVGTDRPLHGSRVNHQQFAKNVTLQLYTNGRIDGNLMLGQQFVFPINPEEFTIDRHERVQVVQTLGEPFIDEYGKGLPKLIIRGTTGWRIRPSIDKVDGHEAFRRLHRNFIDRYFDERQNRLINGLDPDDVILVVVNSVDDLCYKIVPENFKLLRNRTKPLLYQYELSCVVLKDLNAIDADQGIELKIKPQSRNWLSALKDRAAPLVRSLKAFATPVCDSMANFITASVDVLQNAKSGVGDVANFLNGVSTSIKLTLDATRDTQQFIKDLPLEAILELNTLTSVIGEFSCYLQNGAIESWLPDFSGICGVSDCAATHGVEVGEVAAAGGNAIEWVVGLSEAARLNGSAALIGFRHDQKNLANMFDESNAPIIMDSSLDSRMASLQSIKQSPASAGGLSGVYGAIGGALDAIDIDAARIPADASNNESLKKINQIKVVEVKDGETLQTIAYREYGDAARWTEIAAANNIIIEPATERLAPLTSFVVDVDLHRSTREMDIGIAVPSNYAQPGSILLIKDQAGRQQRVSVASISGTVIRFNEAFSQNYIGPLLVVRLVDLSQFGVFDGEVTLVESFPTGRRTMRLDQVKDIYPGFILYVAGSAESRPFTVQSINYLERTVRVAEPSVGFSAGIKLQVYDRERHQTHIVAGTRLKIPVTSGDKTNLIQTANEVYGCDIATDADGYLQVTNGGFARISGLDNLKQAIAHRIMSDYESLLVHPRYGCGLLAIIGDKNTPAVLTLAKAALIDALNREPRLNRVAKLNAFSIGDAVKFSVEVESVNSNTVADLNFVIGGKA